MTGTIRVLIADDHPLLRAGLRDALSHAPDLALAGEAADGNETQRLCRALRPDVLLLDLRMPGPPPAATVAAVRACCPATQVLVLTAYRDPPYVREMTAAGVAGYLLKDEQPEAIVEAIRRAAAGGVWFSQAIVRQLARPHAGADAVEGVALSSREQDVLRLVAGGKSNKAIAEELYIAEKTVRNHLTAIYDKLGVHDRAEAVVWAWRHGLVAAADAEGAAAT